jgi:hypothetical protein
MSKLLADNVWFKIGDAFYKLSEWVGGMVPFGTAAGKFLYTTGEKVWAEADITSYGRSVVGGSGKTATLLIEIGNGVTPIQAGFQFFVPLDHTGSWTGYTLTAKESGSIVVDLWKDTYANFPPTVADTITASAKPTLSTAQKALDSTLTGWTPSFTAGDVLGINVDSATTITQVTLALKATVTSV